ncbi:hypothetical protein CYMTET_44060 [Cymbomonas tetramitiformis]|uniref:Protein-serine/threonine kinase n=1 Tax=Cymbomonas tetramitiformis TaxID=36881 RepID=A0AAE0F129_9CHLO|nr:hypothetical protein CYMTET_44060 [Cymbomonas tetramitiformis]
MQEMLEFGKRPTPSVRLHVAKFVHRELAIRYAVRIHELQRLPQWCGDIAAFHEVQNIYLESFRKLRHIPAPQDSNGVIELTNLLEDISQRHGVVLKRLAAAVHDLRKKGRISSEAHSNYLECFLDRNMTARIGTLMLTQQHLSLQPGNHQYGWVGNIQLECRPANICHTAAFYARELCEKEYGWAPEVQVHGDTDAQLAYFPAYIHYVMGELLKNAVRATMERNPKDPPPVEVEIGGGDTEVGVCVRDHGGGIPRELQEKVWQYSFTSVKQDDRLQNVLYEQDRPLLAGLGFGLPLSRLYARYFGGDIQLNSLVNRGTSAYYQMNRLGEVSEAIPEYYLRKVPLKHDWKDE